MVKDEDFNAGAASIGGLRVTNDKAEGWIVLIRTFNRKISKSKYQHLLQVIEE